MCGIVGALSLNRPTINVNYIKSMADKIAHRGPDDAGYLCFHTGARHNEKISFYQNLTDEKFKNIEDMLPTIESNSAQRELHSHDYDLYMGHRRLSILDVSYAGHQPMSDLSKNIWIAYNGEIYNFKELKIELEELGHRFKSQTDTEVIIYAYIEWGIECIKRFNGMFAFSLYDNFNKKFYLCRDRYGIKPVYYHITQDKTFIYASEIKSILEYKDYKSEVDKEALLEYFTFQNIFTNKTLHKDIQILEAGHYFEIDLLSKEIEKKQYWDFDFSQPETIKDEREYIEELDRLFTQAVQRQLISDVPVGSYLSGGMDSGSITAIASNHFQKSNDFLKTFTVGFDLSSASGMELSFDERAKSEYMSYMFKTEHYEMVLKSGDMERCMNNFAYHLEEPRVGQSYPNYYASKLASKFVKVVLSGAGGDELFAGYPWRYYKAVNNDSFDNYIDKYYGFWKRLIPNKDIQNVFSPILKDTKVWTKDIFASVFKTPVNVQTPEEYINHSLYFEAKTFLHGLLVVDDKLSMAHSLETRVPFLDNDLVDFAQKIPVKFKLANLNKVIKMDENEIGKMQKTNDGKVILRKAMSKYIPEDIHKAVKQGFSSPDNSWFKGESIDFVKAKLLNSDANIYKYMDKAATQKLINEHLEGKQNRRLFVWSLLNFEEWSSIYD
ncbi:asparagine synthetase [Aliarcobacter butzleri RM4018]|uniref:asparagine synthase (glutamine-hydrolyzing) n=1 Tax=Aliarcobacter butzleri (strain RM4018) TaxID=367737 RepID=A8ESK9_ALIB4|nr:asparagine synthase (glutamine-hydrolyzing) [Aliarcobacter butzleri]ABV66933.1 asparagine synthetase [Aliarcobacter butzleri RM4018]GGT80813.1 asparagine synthetase B [Aliarcobacter butzleri]SNV26096.1 Asparagine synthetase [glutamine-hydrolyzing] 1 [Aliarcobacter butzleri]